MSLRFTVLASGSSGNASLVEADGFGVLLDAGIGPRTLAQRLTLIGASWRQVQAMVLTHTHTDHWQEATFRHFVRRRIPVYCHTDHQAELTDLSQAFASVAAAGLVRLYEPGEILLLAPGLQCQPLPIRHDSGSTFGFRFEGSPDLFGQARALAYLADLGCWDDELIQSVLNVDLLALEFNHDVEMERTSGRPLQLIARVLGDEGHLSNAQAAQFVREVLRRSTPERLRHLVQLHLSRECNRPRLAAAVARAVLGEAGCNGKVFTAKQDRPSGTFDLGGAVARRTGRMTQSPERSAVVQHPSIPGLEIA
jgi:phosphoribosyl 1,2-cyclic phosphodiesterase